MKIPPARSIAVLLLSATSLLAGCAATPPAAEGNAEPALAAVVAETSASSVLGPDARFTGSTYADVGLSGLFPVRTPAECQVAVLHGGEDSFAVRLESLKNARKSIRIQALVFKGDETGLRIAEILKQKKAQGLDVRVIVDAFSNPWLQTQWMYFDLKQNGIEVEGYEAMALQWLNELPIPNLVPHTDPDALDKRYHEKMWIIDGETADAVAITGGLNVGNEYFRANPDNPDGTWRDQDIVMRGAIVGDLVAAFDRNFDYFVGVKKSRGALNTNLYWDATRAVLDKTGRMPIHYTTDPQVVQNVAALESRRPALQFRGATCRFLQNRPRLGESYIQQAYVKLIERAEREVLIANAYFIPTPSLFTALTDAAKRCASVRLISNSPATNDLPEITLVGRGYYKDLLAVNESAEVKACGNADAGLRIWEWVGQAPDEPARNQGTMHSKYAVFDGVRGLVGSYNLDPRSEKLNSETAVVFLQPELAGQLRTTFITEDLRYAREVTPEEAAQFESPASVVERFRKSLGKAFEEHL
jgi:phosphatidylserine/phosphatidylglycerophosphate/cardiolipin synthase-like enzyme